MNLTKTIVAMVAALILSTAMVSSTAFATPSESSDFSALQGVDALALSAEEMQSISGELNALDIAAALDAQAAKLPAGSRLQAGVIKLANFYRTNAAAINKAFMKLGVYTDPKP